MRIFYFLAAFAACTLAAPHAAPSDKVSSSSQLQHLQPTLHKRQQQMRTLGSPKPSTKAPSSRPEDASRRQAFELAASNYDSHISKSVAAAKASGGAAAIWAAYVPAGSNPFAQIYAGNGKGALVKAKANAKGLGTGKGSGTGNSQVRAVVAMMEQIGMKG